jgi:hypothetical protein
MMDLYLSSDGKHTVHVAAQTPEEMVKLMPQAKMIYEAVVRTYGTKAQMWKKRANGRANGNGNGQGQAERKGPLCPVHKAPMAYREVRYGAFWSCPTR